MSENIFLMSKFRLPKYETPPLPQSLCPVSGKNQYASEEEALRAAKYREKNGSVSLGAYKCIDCFCWHLTSK